MTIAATLINLTPFVAGHFLLPDGEGGEVVLVLVKATLDVDDQGVHAIAAKPEPLGLTDEFWGEPARSSPKRDSDLCLAKPRVDVLVSAMAHAPGGQPCERTGVELHVGSQSKQVWVSGDRVWIDDQPSAPVPFTTMPLVWERAYGGSYSREQVDERNPLGIGHASARSADREVLSELPNLEDPAAPMTHAQSVCAPVGFGVVGRAWLPRRPLAGTFDFVWKRERWPLAPHDFDPAFHQSAPRDQQIEGEIGGELVRLVHMTPAGEWSFRVPILDVPLHFVHADRRVGAPLRVDTLEIDALQGRVILTGRALLRVDRGRAPLTEIVVGDAGPAWFKAKRSGKRHLDLRGPAGARSYLR